MKHLSKLSDEELVVLYSEGNNKAFDILLTRYKNRIYSYIFYKSHQIHKFWLKILN